MKVLLNEDWQMTWELLSSDVSDALRVQNKEKEWLKCDLPCDVHSPLIANGIIAEPLLEDYCFASEWTEHKSWWFKKKLRVMEQQITSDRIELIFESLDAEADVWLNDVHIGHHRSAFYPLKCDVKKLVKAGDNTLLVRVTSGLEHYSSEDLKLTQEATVSIVGDLIGVRGDERRVMVRKPQYGYGWDWGPRVATCGIVKNVWIEYSSELAIRDVQAVTAAISSETEVHVRVELENLHPFMTKESQLEVEILLESQRVAFTRMDIYLRSGLNYISLNAVIPDAKLWWPNGMGEQTLYTINVTAKTQTSSLTYPSFQFGIRTLRLKMEKLSNESEDRSFTFEVNGIALFAKGANWIPADSIYARVTDESYDTLIREAKNAHFNMLRIWGGGIYERDVFYEKCDQYGILLWQDFMFACAKYPDHLTWFREEVEREMDYQTRRLRNHCSLALWCGNNENHWGFDEWWNETDAADYYGGAACYNEIAPRIVERNCPEIPYWNSSPYGGEHPNGSVSGDRHHWHDCMMSTEMEKRITPEEYDKVTAKFVSEYGYVGPCRKSSIEKYHNGNPVVKGERIWELHNNTYEKDTVFEGIRKHYIVPEQLETDEYLLYAGLCQGLMLSYSLEAFRCKLYCSGGLFWMYNDCWGEVGWTIIDYYLTRKISYYFVKRAFEPVKLILRQEQGIIRLIAINETNEMINETLEYGRSRFDGTEKVSDTLAVNLPPYSRSIVLEWKPDEVDTTESFYYAKPLSGADLMKPATLRTNPFRQLRIPDSQLTLSNIWTEEQCTHFTVTSAAYAHAVHFGLADHLRLSDEYFDLLPGEQRNITLWIPAAEALTASAIVPRAIKVN